MKLFKACIAMAAFAAIFVVPSAASAITLTAPTGTTYSGNIIATNVAHDKHAKHTLMTIPGFATPITCDVATLTGNTVVSDAANHVVGEITTAEFKGATGSTCSGPIGAVTVTPNHTSAEFTWCITAEKEDRIRVWTKKAGKTCTVTAPEDKSPLTFILHSSLTGACTYSKTELIGTYTTHPNDAIATVEGQEFTKTAGGGFCPGSGKLEMAFTLTEDLAGEKHGNPIYIDPTA